MSIVVIINIVNIYVNLVLHVELRRNIVCNSILLGDVGEDLGAPFQVIDSVEVTGTLGHPVKGNSCHDIQGNGEVHQVEGVRTYYCQKEDPCDLAESFGDHDHCSDRRLLLCRNMFHQ